MTSMIENYLGNQDGNIHSCEIKENFMESVCVLDLDDCLDFSYDAIGTRVRKR